MTTNDPETPKGALVMFGLLGIGLLVGSGALFTLRRSVRIDAQKKLVERKMSALIWDQTKIFSVSDFKEVKITTYHGKHGHIYGIVLSGPETISLPGTSSGGYEAILSKAKKVAEITGLPLKEA